MRCRISKKEFVRVIALFIDERGMPLFMLKVDQLVLCTLVAEEEPPVAAQTPLIQMAW